MGQEISFNRLYWLCEQFCDLRTAIRGSADPALDLKLTLIRLSHQEIVSSDTVKLAEEISMLKKELAQLKGMIRQNGVISTQAEVLNQYRADNLENTAEDAGFHENPDLDIPFENEERAASVYDAEAPKEDEKPQTARDTEGGMQTDREEAEVISTDLKPDIPEDDITASDLFKILR